MQEDAKSSNLSEATIPGVQSCEVVLDAREENKNALKNHTPLIQEGKKIFVKKYPLLKPNPLYPHKKALLEYEWRDITPQSIIIRQEFKGCHYSHFKSYHDFDKYRVQAPHEEFFHEVIFGSKPQKPYFDIDGKDLSPEDGKQLFDELITGIIKTHDKITLQDIIAFNSHRPEKISYHVVVDKWLVANNEQNEAFFQLVKLHVNPRFYKYFDKLYKSTQNFRVYNSMKPENMIRKQRDPACKWVPDYSDGHTNERLVLGASLVSNASYGTFLPTYAVEEKKKSEVGPIDQDVDVIIKMCEKYYTDEGKAFPFEFVETVANLIILQKKESWECLKCNRTHDSVSPFISIMGHNKDIYFHCRRQGASIHIGKLYNNPVKVSRDYMPKQLYESITQAVPGKRVVINRYTERYVKSLSDDYVFQIIKSATKTGKTTSLIEFLRRHPELRFVSLSPRISYALSMTETYIEGGLQCDCYLDKVNHTNKNLVISAESLYNLHEVYDVVIIDEVSSFLSQMNSGFHKDKLQDNIKTLDEILRNAKYVICMDATITQGTFKLLENIRKEEKIHYHINDFKNSVGLTVYDHVENYVMFGLIRDHIIAGKNIQIVLGAESTGIYYIEPLLKSLGLIEGEGGYIFHHSKGSDYRHVLHQVKLQWVKYRVVIYTSTVGPGIDFPIPHFHVRFSFYNSMTTTASQFGQMRMRVRNLIDNVEFTSFKLRCEKKLASYVTHDAIRHKYDKFLNASSAAARKVLKGYERCKIRYRCHNSNRLIWKYEDNMWTWNAIEDERQVNISKCWLYPIVVRDYKASGATFKQLDKEFLDRYEKEAETWKVWMEDMRDQSKRDLIQKYEYVDVEEHNEKDLNMKVKEGNATEMEKITAKKIKIVKKLVNGVHVSGEQCILYNNHYKQLDNGKMCVEYSFLAILANDIYFTCFSNIPRLQLLQFIAIGKLCQKLSIPNQTCVRNPIDRETIELNLGWFCKMHSCPDPEESSISYKDLFSLRSDPLKNYRGVTTMISSIFTAWCRSKLSKQEIYDIKGTKYKIHRLEESVEGFDELFNLLAPKKKYGVEDIITLEDAPCLPETITVMDIKDGDIVAIQVPRPESLLDQVNSMNNSRADMLERKNDVIDPPQNHTLRYRRYEGILKFSDYKKAKLLVVKNGKYELNEAGIQAKKDNDILTQNLLNERIIFKYDNPGDPLNHGLYYSH